MNHLPGVRAGHRAPARCHRALRDDQTRWQPPRRRGAEAGTSCTEALAWLGADVIKVENPAGGEQGRRASADREDMDSWYFMVLNANKRSITLNLKADRGKAMLRDMIPKADVIIENFAPGAIARMGFGFDDVKAIKPDGYYGYDIDGLGGEFARIRTRAPGYHATTREVRATGEALRVTLQRR